MRKFLFGSGTVSLVALAVLVVGCGGDDGGSNPAPTPCSIEIYGPSEGQIITAPAQTDEGDRLDIRWNAEGGGQVRVELLKGGELLGVLYDETDNNGYAFWYIDAPVTSSGDDYQVRVTHLGTDGCDDTGPEFTIRDLRACGIELTINYPNMRYGNPAQAGDIMDISWVPTSTTGIYTVEMWQFATGGPLVGVIAEDVTANEIVGGWVIDSFHVGTSWYYIKVVDQEIGSCFALSDDFEMRDDVVCAMEFFTPMDGRLYAEGSQLEITWDADNTTGLVDLELWYGEASRAGIIAVGVDATDDAYMWTVNDFDYPGVSFTSYKIHIIDHEDPYCFVFSKNFGIPR